jgi:hypothetical protein
MEELEDGVRERRIRQDGAPEHFGLRQDCIATLSDHKQNKGGDYSRMEESRHGKQPRYADDPVQPQCFD